jgi:hypothetical protein
MTKFISFFLILPLFIFTACQFNKPNISQLWFYTYSSDSSIDPNTLTPANFLELRPDKTFTSDLGKFRSGHWSQKDRQLFLNADDGDISILMINELKKNEIQLQSGHTNAANFDAQPLPAIEKDPFSNANNNWRKIAVAKETDVQIRKRLRSHCGFWVAYFTWALDNELTTVDVRSTPTPIKIYGNGFTIKPYNDLPDTWKGYFYDSTDCRKANEVLEELVRTHTIAWAHTDNKYKMFISAFQQMEHFLK